MFDTVITGAAVCDGTGSPPLRADIGLIGDRIAAVGSLAGRQSAEAIDATGRLVMPGFIDAHSHADSQVLEPGIRHALLRQGVTTVITGQDGLGFAPGRAATQRPTTIPAGSPPAWMTSGSTAFVSCTPANSRAPWPAERWHQATDHDQMGSVTHGRVHRQ